MGALRFRLVVDGEAHEIEAVPRGGSWEVRVDGAVYRARTAVGGREIEVRIGRGRHRIRLEGLRALVDGVDHELRAEIVETEAIPAPGMSSLQRERVFEIRPPMPGRVVRLAVAQGVSVKRGQTLAVLEAMKMQNEIPAPADGVVREVHVREGESIPADRLIAVLVAS